MNTNVLDYGAKAHLENLCTKEIQSAIDACYASGGGIVTVPAGFYRTGTLCLRSNVELHLETCQEAYTRTIGNALYG